MVREHLSKFEIIWGTLLGAIVFTVAFKVPLALVFKSSYHKHDLITDAILSIIMITDFYINRKKTKLNRVNTNKTYTVASILGAIPIEIILFSIFPTKFLFLRALRLFILFPLIHRFSITINQIILGRRFRIILVMSAIIMSLHWIACGWIAFAQIDGPNQITIYNKSIYWAVATLTTIGYGDIVPTDNISRMYTMLIMMLGVGVYGLVIGNMAQLIYKADRYKEEQKRKMEDLASYMRYYKIPEKLQYETFTLYRHLLSKKLSDDAEHIISELPRPLQEDLNIYKNIKLLGEVPTFKQCSLACLKMMARNLHHLYLSPGKQIITKGEEGNEMYIIGHGKVDICSADGAPVTTLGEGQFFGELALLKETKRSHDVRARNYCDIYTLTKENFEEITKKFPELKESILKISKKRRSDKNVK